MSKLNETTFAGYARSLRLKGRSEQTIESYSKALTELDRFLGGADVTEATRADVERYLEKRMREIQISTLGIRYRSLRAFYAWCVEEGILTETPMKGVTEPRGKNKPVPVLSDDDLRALLKACSGKSLTDRRDEALIRLLCEPGSPRLGELFAMDLKDVDLKHDMITVTGKTGQRSFPFGAKTGTALERYIRLRGKTKHADDPALWLSPLGRLTPSGIEQLLNRRSRAAGLGRINPHRLRHTAASRWLESGGAEGDAIQLFGWADATMIHKVYGRSAAAVRAHKAARRSSMGDRL